MSINNNSQTLSEHMATMVCALISTRIYIHICDRLETICETLHPKTFKLSSYGTKWPSANINRQKSLKFKSAKVHPMKIEAHI